MICALLLVLPGLLPVAAQAGGGDAVWIEICGENGPETVAFDLSGGAPVPVAPECPDCGDCLMCTTMGGAILIAVPGVVFAPVAGGGLRPAFVADIHKNPAQFWPDNRGPPRGIHDVYPAEFSAVTASVSFERRAL